MPCLNEADTLATCIRKALRAMDEHGIAGEVIVADNGSTDGSQEIARRRGRAGRAGRGARLRQRADGRHRGRARRVRAHGRRRRQLRLPRAAEFVDKLREGYDLVQGCRLERAAGRCCRARCRCCIAGGAIPMFSALARSWFHAPINDVYCGMRGFTKDALRALDQRCTGMEFATEMIIKSSLTRRASPRCRSRCIRMDARPTRRTCGPSATAGGRCASSCCTARAGCSCSRGSLLIAARAARLRARDAGVHVFGRHLRRPHAALRQPGDHLRLPGDPLRRLHQGVRRSARACATGRTGRTLRPAISRSSAGSCSAWWRCSAGCAAARRRHLVAGRTSARSTTPHDARGRSRA